VRSGLPRGTQPMIAVLWAPAFADRRSASTADGPPGARMPDGVTDERLAGWRKRLGRRPSSWPLDQAPKQGGGELAPQGERATSFRHRITNVSSNRVAFGAIAGAGLIVLAVTDRAGGDARLLRYPRPPRRAVASFGVIRGRRPRQHGRPRPAGAVIDFIAPVLCRVQTLLTDGIGDRNPRPCCTWPRRPRSRAQR